MANRDSFNRSFPITIHYREKELADANKINAFEKMSERAFENIERAIGDIYNTENAVASVISGNQLFINSLGRAVGSMTDIIPPLSGIQQYSPALSYRMQDMTYNVIPHPDQTIKLEVGCKYDTTELPESTERTCVKDQTAFYRQVQGTNTGICQNTSCPFWSARDGRKINSSIYQSDPAVQTFREYKLVVPKETRTVIQPRLLYYTNAGITYDKYRVDGGQVGFGTDRSDPSQTYAIATNESIAVSGVSEEIKYEYKNLDLNSTYNMVIELPALDLNQTVYVNNVPLATITGSSDEATRYLFNLEGFKNLTVIRVSIKPSNTSTGTRAAVSQIWIIENKVQRHRNYGIPLILPKVLDNLAAGTEIPGNFLQVFDTTNSVNRVLDNIRAFTTRFNPKDPSLNINSHRDAFDITIYSDQKLEIGNDRYLAVTVGAPVASALGALLEAFVEHVSDESIHLSRPEVCELLSKKSSCCEDRLKLQIDSLYPPDRIAGSSPATYQINAFIYGGYPPYTVTINWGDGITDSAATPQIVSGVQVFELSSDVRPTDPSYRFQHVYVTAGTFNITFNVQDDPDKFGCTGSLTNQVSPFNAGYPPAIDSEVRLDYATLYPRFAYQDITAGYNFTETDEANWTTNPTYHILTQVHNSDPDTGKPVEFYWSFDNPEGLTFQFYYEDVSGVNQGLAFIGGSATLSHTLVQQDSLAITKNNTVFKQDIDYFVNWASGTITTSTSGSIGANESGFTARYFVYNNAANASQVSGQWVTLGAATNARTINLSDYTPRIDINTIRMKIKK